MTPSFHADPIRSTPLPRLGARRAALGSALLLSCAAAGPRPAAGPGIPHQAIHVSRPTLFPEGIAFNPVSGRFLLGSFREGAVYEIGEDGTPRALVTDDRLHSVLGVCVDAKRNRLLVANSDIGSAARPEAAGPAKLASLGIYALDTGAPLHLVDLGALVPGAPHLANDLTIDVDGNAYVTDSFSPVVYKVDLAGTPSVFVQDERFRGGGVNLNGIVHHPDGFLLVVKKSDGSLWRIPLDRPNDLTQVQVDVPLVGGDGLVLAEAGTLFAIANKVPGTATNAVFTLRSKDGWRSARVASRVATGDVYPTTGALAGGKLWVVHTRLDTLISAPAGEKATVRETPLIEPVGGATPQG
jgi:sugar lactone lactonase YvrE